VRCFPLMRTRTRALPTVALAVALVCCACRAPAAPAAPAASGTPAATASSWDAAQQRQVLAAGLMQESGTSFDGAGELSAAQANATMIALSSRLTDATGEPGADGEGPGEGPASGAQALPGAPGGSSELAAAGTVAAPVAQTAENPVTVVSFDRMLVEELGLAAVAAHVQEVAATVGLRPPAYFGSEVVTRFLELRYEHPVGSQRLDLFPQQPITRAEAAWSLGQVMSLSSWSIASAREALSAFELPQMTAAQLQALRIAVSRIGYPYVWGGTTDTTADGLEHGGFDCSGFAWRVYKVSGLPWGNEIKGRTAAEQAGEIPRSQRLAVGQLEPGDLLFFGSAHFNSRATASNVIHEGIYLGENWVIHSSGQGVYVLPLSGSWLGSSFAWGRRVIG
jgi:cell wall-associated NlpC family hydrolase